LFLNNFLVNFSSKEQLALRTQLPGLTQRLPSALACRPVRNLFRQAGEYSGMPSQICSADAAQLRPRRETWQPPHQRTPQQ
jgi:hypothetical protein